MAWIWRAWSRSWRRRKRSHSRQLRSPNIGCGQVTSRCSSPVACLTRAKSDSRSASERRPPALGGALGFGLFHAVDEHWARFLAGVEDAFDAACYSLSAIDDVGHHLVRAPITLAGPFEKSCRRDGFRGCAELLHIGRGLCQRGRARRASPPGLQVATNAFELGVHGLPPGWVATCNSSEAHRTHRSWALQREGREGRNRRGRGGRGGFDRQERQERQDFVGRGCRRTMFLKYQGLVGVVGFGANLSVLRCCVGVLSRRPRGSRRRRWRAWSPSRGR